MKTAKSFLLTHLPGCAGIAKCEKDRFTLNIIHITPWDVAFLLTSVIHDYRDFDRVVGLACEFYRKTPSQTLIIVASDHESGGLGMTLAVNDMSSTKGCNQATGKLDDCKFSVLTNVSLVA